MQPSCSTWGQEGGCQPARGGRWEHHPEEVGAPFVTWRALTVKVLEAALDIQGMGGGELLGRAVGEKGSLEGIHQRILTKRCVCGSDHALVALEGEYEWRGRGVGASSARLLRVGERCLG